MPLSPTLANAAPPGAVWSDISAADGMRLRTARWTPLTATKGTITLLGGRGEFIEKYFEVIGELLARGFAVATMDWRGQGGSDRLLPNARKGHVDDFSHYARDLDALIEKILKFECPHPWYGLCHSMGAAVLLGVVAGGRHPFERLVLTSPMIAVKGVNHHGPKRLLASALVKMGFGGAFAPGASATSLWLSPFERNVFTSDPVRFARVSKLIAERPELSLGGPTIGWTRAAFRHMSRLEDLALSRRIATPVLIVAAGADRVTDAAAALEFAPRLGVGRAVVIEGAEHDIMIERNDLRAKFWAAFDQFVPGPPPNSSH